MTHRKTRRNNKRKTVRRRKTIRHKKGGVVYRMRNQPDFNDFNNEFIQRRQNLINNVQNIIDRAEVAALTNNADVMVFIDEIREFEREADTIDRWFNDVRFEDNPNIGEQHEMENMLNEAMGIIMEIFGLVNHNIENVMNELFQGNINNNATVISPPSKRIRNTNSNNGSNSNTNMN